MRIDFVYVTISSGAQIAINPAHLVSIEYTPSGLAKLILVGREPLDTSMNMKQAITAFGPMQIAGQR